MTGYAASRARGPSRSRRRVSAPFATYSACRSADSRYDTPAQPAVLVLDTKRYIRRNITWTLLEAVMRLSARNVLKGSIVEVVKGQTTAHVRIDVSGTIVTASITNE